MSTSRPAGGLGRARLLAGIGGLAVVLGGEAFAQSRPAPTPTPSAFARQAREVVEALVGVRMQVRPEGQEIEWRFRDPQTRRIVRVAVRRR